MRDYEKESGGTAGVMRCRVLSGAKVGRKMRVGKGCDGNVWRGV